MVFEQGTIIDRIDFHVEQTCLNAQKAKKELAQVSKLLRLFDNMVYRQKKRWMDPVRRK